VALLAGGWISEQLLPRPFPPGMGPRAEMMRRLDVEPPPGLPPPRAGRPLPPDAPPGGPPRDARIAQHRRFSSITLWSRSRLNLPVYVVIVSVVHAFALYRRVQERDRRALELTTSLSQAKLQALRLQLQPHFLFNTLNAISTLVHTDPDRADEMIVNLSEMLRLSLAVGEQEVPLRREIEILDRYLQIEQMRLGERLRVERAIEPTVLDARVPPLLLQTIVENAIRHGIEPRAAPGTVRVSAAKAGERLRLLIADDGIGLASSGRFSERRGVGLANTESRLAELYGADGRIELHEPAEGGCRVEITIPLRAAYPVETTTSRPASS
jgi:hypothetical protein